MDLMLCISYFFLGCSQWALGVTRSLEFHRLCQRNHLVASGAVMVSVSDSHNRTLSMWLCPIKHAYSGVLLKLEVSLNPVAAGVEVCIAVPTIAVSTANLFSQYFNDCVNEGAKLLVTLQYVRWGFQGATCELRDYVEGDDALCDLEMLLDDTMPRKAIKEGLLPDWVYLECSYSVS